MLKDVNGNKMTPKDKVKELLQKHFNDFNVEALHEFETFSKGEQKKVKEQFEKITVKMDKLFAIKPKGE